MPDDTENNNNNNDGTQIVNAGMALAAMRHAPYRTASAVAELIDNSIQAKANNISLIAKDEYHTRGQQTLSRLSQLAIFDDGVGMDKTTLENALAVGFSRNREDPDGIGKFGFGMTVGSLSQTFKVEVYSWQKNGPILFTYIDLENLLETGAQTIPAVSEIPSVPLIHDFSHVDGLIKKESGTLVIWSKLDPKKVKYSTSKGIFNHLNLELGRIYRHFLDDDDDYGKKRNIRVISLDPDGAVIDSDEIIANDPLYLLTPNTLPPHNDMQYNNEATNILLDEKVHQVEIKYLDPNDEEQLSIVEIRATIAKPEIRAGIGGASSIGKHYAKNQGISFVRAGREIELKSGGWVNSYDPRERWWGVELRFSPCLDDVLGVTNDKQYVKDVKKLDDSTPAEYFIDAETDYSSAANIRLNEIITPLVKNLQKIVKSNPVTRGGDKDLTPTEDKVSDRVKEDNSPTISEPIAAEKTLDEKIKELASVFVINDPTLTEEQATARAEERITRMVDFITISWPGSMFLERVNMGEGVHAHLNINSAFYKHFYQYLEDLEDPKPSEAVKIILMAFIRTEDELAVRFDPDNEIFSSFRERWGYWVSELIKLSNY